MSEKKVVLITGVAGYWGSRMAAKLIELNEQSSPQAEVDEPGDWSGFHILGLDFEPPHEPIKGLDFIQADIRNPLFVELLQNEHVHTIIHLAFLSNNRPSEKAFDLNVIGTMKVLGAAAEAGVKRVILQSSTMVYGATPLNPAFITESHPLHGSKSNGSIRNLVDIEAFVNGFRRQSPGMLITILRFANIVGPTVDSPLTQLLQLKPPFVLFGFDPLMQIIHENDVLEALSYATLQDVPGVYNIAAEGILPLGKILGLTGKLPLPLVHPVAYWGTRVTRATGLKQGQYFPIEPDYIRYPWVADLARMREEMGYLPSYTAEETLREFAGQLRLKKYKSDELDMEFDTERLRDTLDRRRRRRESQSKTSVDEQPGGDS